MKNSAKKFLSGLAITAITMATGFIITAISFNLFETLTQNQMRLVFAIDVIILLVIGTISWFIYENKQLKEKRKKETELRHIKRVREINKQNQEIINIISRTNIAA